VNWRLALFVLVGPVVELGAGPLVLTGFRIGDDLPGAWPLRAAGALLLAGCLLVLADALLRFAREGGGTPSPLLPPVRPVEGGVYGRLRHPMYVATTLGLVGEALLLRQAILLAAAALFALTMTVLVRRFEEPQLRQRFGERWRS
jgi:protein-S-isoprenylcysteine O-methyltransferase Ste14